MYGWPQQSSDAELEEARRLGDELTAQGFVCVHSGDLCGGGSSAVISPWDVRVALLRAGFNAVKYEPTGEEPVADVTQVSGEVWVPAWMHPVIVAAATFARLHRPGPRATTEQVQGMSVANVPAFAAYIEHALTRLRTDEDRRAMLAAVAVGGHVVVNELLMGA